MPKTLYRCIKCGREHGTYKEATGCEKSHLSASAVTSEKYRIGPYPFRVVLTFPDGAERGYTIED